MPRIPAPSPAPSPAPRLPGVDGLRALAALAITALHVWLYTTPASGERGDLLTGVLHELRLALPLFFVISGFLLYRGWVASVLGERAAPRLRRYLEARVRRLVPGAWLCLAITFPLLLLVWPDVRGVSEAPASWLWLFAVFGQAFHPETVAAVNPPMWTLTTEASFYLLLPLLAAPVLALAGPGVARVRTPRARRAVLLLAPLVLAVAGTAFNVWLAGRPGNLVLASTVLALGPAFAAGMAAAVLAHGRTLPRGGAVALYVLGVTLVIADGVWHETGTAGASDLGRIVRDLPAAVGFALVLMAATTAGRPSRFLDRAPLTWVGDRSYGLYLWHMPVIYALRGTGLFPEDRTVPALLLVLAIALPIADRSWRWVEEPFLRRRSRGPGPGLDRAPERRRPGRVPGPSRSSPAAAGAVRS